MRALIFLADTLEVMWVIGGLIRLQLLEHLDIDKCHLGEHMVLDVGSGSGETWRQWTSVTGEIVQGV